MKYKDSWLIDEDYLIKITDKSFFFEPSTGIPQQLVLEWLVDKNLFSGINESQVVLLLQGQKYQARIVLNKANRVVMHFSKDFIHHVRAATGFAFDEDDLEKKEIFKTFDYPLVKFSYNNGVLEVSLCRSNSIENRKLRNNHDCSSEAINLFVYSNIKKQFELVEPPKRKVGDKRRKYKKTHKPMKPDYVARQVAATKIGLEGELLACELIKAQLEQNYGPDSRTKVTIEHVASTDDSKGYDIEIYNQDGSRTYIEVKTTKNSINTPFYITENELNFSEKNSHNYYLYRLFEFNYSRESVKYYVIHGNLKDQLDLFPIQYLSYPKN